MLLSQDIRRNGSRGGVEREAFSWGRAWYSVFLFFLFFFVLNEMLDFRVGYRNKILFVSMSAAAALCFFLSARSFLQYGAVLIVCLFATFSIFLNIDGGTSYIYSDAFLLISVTFFYLSLRDGYKEDFERWLWFLFWACFFVFILVWSLGLARENGRFPSVSPYVFSLFLIVHGDQFKRWILYLVSAILLLVIFFSGDRTSFIVAFLILFLLFSRDVFSGKSFYVWFLAVGLCVFLVLNGDVLYGYFLESRLSTVSDLEGDYSSMQRLYEIRDVLSYSYKDYLEGGWRWLFGFGSGATFVPIESWSPQNILNDGSVHHIHATPFVMLYRYGFLGFSVWVFLLGYFSCKGFLAFRMTRNFLFVGLVFCMLMDQFLRNVIVNPMFFVAASYIVLSASRKSYAA